MPRGMPERGDPHRLAELGRTYEGEIPFSAFGRLRESLVPSDGAASYEIRFERDERGRGHVTGRVRARLPLKCQRCLETYELVVNREWRLTLIEDPAEEALLDEGEDACLVHDAGMRLSDLVEDELILALPVVPLHPDSAACRMPVNPVGDEAESSGREENPFAELARLKRRS